METKVLARQTSRQTGSNFKIKYEERLLHNYIIEWNIGLYFHVCSWKTYMDVYICMQMIFKLARRFRNYRDFANF